MDNRGIAIRSFILFFFTCTLFSIPLSVDAQDFKISSSSTLAEKIYIKSDSELYTTKQIIWLSFKVTEAATNRPTKLSGVLYVELIDADENVRDEKVVKLRDGAGKSFFELGNQYLPGSYLIRAYTAWNENFDKSFIAKKYIKIYPDSEKNELNPIQNVYLVEESPGELVLKANFMPLQIDSLHQKKLDVFIVLDGKKDSLSLKENRNLHYQLEYPVSKENRLISLSMRTARGIYYSKTVALKESQPDLSFYPESGHMVAGMLSKVAFKATDIKGKGIKVNGEIIDSNGDLVTSIASNHLGMGVFMLLPDSTQTYHAKIYATSGSSQTYTFNLPQAKNEGQLLKVTKQRNQIIVTGISSSDHSQDSAFIRVSCRGRDYYHLKARLKNGRMTAIIPVHMLPEGVIVFKLLNNHKIPQAERLFFNYRPETRLKIHSKMDSSFYMQREKTGLNIQVTNTDGQGIPAQVSIMVVNQDLKGKSLKKQGNILSDFLFSSDIKGKIERPGYYFDSDHPERLDELDVLLMMQSADTYSFSDGLDNHSIAPEASLKVSGTVSGVFSSKKKKEGIELTLMTFGEAASLQVQNTDSIGRFYFHLPDTYGQQANILLQTKAENGKNRNYSVRLDERNPLEISFDQSEAIENLDSVSRFLVEQQQKKNALEDAFKYSGDNIELKEVIIEGYFLTPQRKKVADRFGKPDVVIDGQEIEAKEEKWSYGLYSILLFNYPKKVRIERVGGAGGYLMAKVLNSELTLVVVDGIPVMNYNYSIIPDIPPSEVKSVELIEYAKGFSNLFMEVYPQAHPLEVPMTGNVIAIYTHAGNGIFSVEKPTGILKTAIPVFSAERDFEAIDHSQLSDQDWKKPDLRSLIHWEPNRTTDDEGKTTIDFYNADIPGRMLVIIEAISEDGSIGYQEASYDVKVRD